MSDDRIKGEEGGIQQEQPGSSQPEAEDRQISFTRRALVQAGWTVPVVLAVKVPAFAQFSPNHQDESVGHDDTPPHVDTIPPHNDSAHDDAVIIHGDA